MDSLHIIGLMHVIMTCLHGSLGQWDGAEMKSDFCTNSTRGKECFMLYHFPSAITWDEAGKFCKSVDSVLASIMDGHIQGTMHNVFNSASMDPSSRPYAWIGGREENNDTWIWLDGSSSKAAANLSTSDYQTCAYLSMVGGAPTLHPLECRWSKKAFVCQKKNAGCIRFDVYSSVEIYISNKSYCSYNQGPAISWYEANNLCQQYGGMLASFPFLPESLAERSRLMANLTSLHNEDTWVGLRRRRWKWEFIQELIMEAPALFVYTNWVTGQPNSAAHRCSYVERWDKWLDESCTTYRLPYTICHNITNIATIPKTTVSNHPLSGTTETPQGSRDDTIIIISALLVLVTGVLVVTIIFVVVRRKSGRSRQSIRDRAHDVEITEITHTTRNSNNFENNGLPQSYEEPALEANASLQRDYAELTSSGYVNVDNNARPIYEELSRNEYENVNTNTKQSN